MKLPFGKKINSEKEVYGRLIVLDGTDGAGKATQTNMLFDTLKTEGYKVETADFPRYGQPSAAMVENYLIAKKYGQLNPKAASIFYAIDRFDASFEIRNNLKAGKIVLSNRYVTANAGHQGGKIKDTNERLKYFRWLANLEYDIFNIPRPDLNIILHVPAEIAQELAKKKWENQKQYMKGKKTDLHEEDLKHLQDAENVYLEIAELFPNTKLIECVEGGRLISPNEVHNKVWQMVRRVGLKDYKI